ncbi:MULTISPECIES: FAD-binding oxidoreductase [unclassified Paraburkholderia]|uniref:NAD(P)/FAD-dependent oxidoreductase n=1 Tax=unclassified Paraburkholderia TaxID=2615204 RepID=UPI00160A1689|nr:MULTISPECIES: FAD-dependent oxidoreductase [unclassified Paraburkholderia]MBB5448368.1 glycine/D-amino acid oxidase-like deaminating enzyme [Paraburkholderia sp. WSM4177]MBB5488749.1 glycine/D-amino acid oxidase-like deaminating enzyme [Paraburkholderia sp. WSM4180]
MSGLCAPGEHYDVLVIGAGIVGLCAAFHLAQRKLRVGLLEQRQAPDNATLSSGAGIRFYDPHPEISAWVEDSHAFYSRLDLGAGFRACPSYYGISSRDAQGLPAEAEQRGFRVLSPAQLQTRWPGLDWRAMDCVIEDPRAGFRDSQHVWRLLIEHCNRLGVRMGFGSPVRRWAECGVGHHHLWTDGARYSAQHVILATGYWTPTLLAQLGLPKLVRNRTVTIHYMEKSPLAYDLPFLVEHESGFHARPTASGGILFGIPQADWDVDPDHLPDRGRQQVDAAVRHLQGYLRVPVSTARLITVRSADAYPGETSPGTGRWPPSFHLLAFGQGAAFKYAPARTLSYLDTIFK